MENIYYKIAHPSGFSGINSLQRASGKSETEVVRFLNKQSVYRKHKIPRKKIKRARYEVHSVGTNFETDLFDLRKYKMQNSHFAWILLVVDIFSNYIKCKPLKNKSGKEVADGLSSIFRSLKNENKLAPKSYLASDCGNEFFNHWCNDIYTKFGVSHFALRAPIKCAYAEISGRYLLDKLYKYMSYKNKKRWIDVLDLAVAGRNKRKSKKNAGLSPIEISYQNQYLLKSNVRPIPDPKFTLRIGDRVQVLKKRLPFSKSYESFYTDKIYQVAKQHKLSVPRYSLIDEDDGEPIVGTWYAEELYRL